MKLLCALILLISLSAQARVVSEEFTSLTYKDSSTLIWNFELGLLHPEIQVFNYRRSGQAIASQTAFSVSDGSDGAFEPATYSQFGNIVGNHITIDANQFPILKVTRFFLDSTHTLSSINGPLVIHSLSTVQIDGIIQCQGNDGAPPSGVAGGAGGTGRCGGFSGGTGGASSTSGANGFPTTGNVTGGGGGFYTGSTPGAGGGGGAGYVGLNGDVGENSNPAANAGGNPGSGFAGVDHGFINLNGSAGGGGGTGGEATATPEGGSGGGAGGGTVVIHAVSGVTITSTGSILAYGGNSGATTNGGSGGGGGGGNVKIITPAKFEIETGAAVDTTAGDGALPGNTDAGQGGSGSIGRLWLVAGSYITSGTLTNGSSLLDEGESGFVSGTTLTATSKSFDTGSTQVIYQSVTTVPVSSDITVQVAGSDDNFATDDTGWINSAAISALAKKRYFKFRVSLHNSDAVNATLVDRVSITYDPGLQENFAFQSAGCGLVKNSNPNMWTGVFLLLIPLILTRRLRKPKTVRVRVKK